MDGWLLILLKTLLAICAFFMAGACGWASHEKINYQSAWVSLTIAVLCLFALVVT